MREGDERGRNSGHGLDARCVCGCAVVCDRWCRSTIEPDRDHAVERLWPADGVHGWDRSAGLVGSCPVLWNGGVHVGVQPGEHTPAGGALAGCWDGGQRSVAGLAPHRGPRRSKDGVPDQRPTGDHDQPGRTTTTASCRTSPTGAGGLGSPTGTAALRPCIRTGPRSTLRPPGPRWTVTWTLPTGGSSCDVSSLSAHGRA